MARLLATRQARARALAFATAVTVVLLAALFASLRNPTPLKSAREAQPSPAQLVQRAAGRQAFERLGCSGCHAIEGFGNPGLPLDGVGSRRTREQLRDYALGTGTAEAELPESIAQMKQRQRDRVTREPETGAALDAVLDLLQASR